MEVGVVASALVKTLCDKLGSPLLNEFSLLWGVDKQLRAFESTISAVKDVLEDAEQCLTVDKAVHNWLQKLKDNVHDADNLLGKWYLEAQRQQNDTRGQTSRGINNTLSRLNLVKQLKLAHNIESINKRLDAVAAERTKFHLKSKTIEYSKQNLNDRKTWSQIDESAIYGRNHEKEEILKWLIQKDVQEHISVISIVGLGGLGKTTLAQLVYNSEANLNEHFDLKMWIYISEIFDVGRIVNELIESSTQTKCEFQNFDLLVEKVKSGLNGKKFLLVMDDVWDENCEQNWEKLKPILNYGSSGSKIVVTTRFLSVSQKMNAIFCSKLEGLPDTISWDLFKQRVGGSEMGVNSRIIEIAKEIMKKCAGVPLALKALGGILSFEDNIEKWLNIRDSDIWELSCGSDQVIKSLKLSYMYLPPSLKECFTYCSIFSKGQVIDKLELIGQWMAHGFICVSGGKGTAEEKGNEYFKHLVQVSFLQNVVGGSNMEQVKCEMHDLVHDLARSVVIHELSVVSNLDTPSSITSCRYMSLSNCSGKIEPSIIKKVRALHIKASDLAVVNMISEAKSLRSLVLDELYLRKEWNICSKKLIHLGYVYLSECDFEEIPFDFCALWSLQSLHLKGCRYIKKLPESIGRVIGLETLKLDCMSLESLPESIGQCRNLQTLIVESEKLKCIPRSISQLENIRLFHLAECYGLKRLPDEVFEKCTSIRSINFYICVNLEEIPASIGSLVNLESLNLSGCESLKSLPNSIGDLQNLHSLDLSSGCESLKSLPNSIGDLQNLHSLDLSSSGIMVLPSSICKLVNLDSLNVSYCDELRELPGSLGEIKKLRFLDMMRTYMNGMPVGIGKLTDLRRLSCFVVTEESKYARILELEHLNLLGGNLKISGLDEVSELREVVSANLKQKKYLDGLSLRWGWNIDAQERDWDVALLEALQPPSGIKNLELINYPGSEYSRWMMLEETDISSFPYLTSVSLLGNFKCTQLPRLVELSSIRHLSLWDMDSLRKFTGYYCQGLVKLVLRNMENLEELTTRLVTCEEHGINYSYESAFPNLSELVIGNCPKLTIKPHLPPSLKELELDRSNGDLLEGAVFSGGEAASQISLPSLGLVSLTMREVKLPIECQILGQLSSLAKLLFDGCQFDNCLPIGMRHLSSLLELRIYQCKGLDSLPEWFGELKSLQHLMIDRTPLTCLPQSMQKLTALESLKIWGCPELEKRCERESGEDWHLISHIPRVYIW